VICLCLDGEGYDATSCRDFRLQVRWILQRKETQEQKLTPNSVHLLVIPLVTTSSLEHLTSLRRPYSKRGKEWLRVRQRMRVWIRVDKTITSFIRINDYFSYLTLNSKYSFPLSCSVKKRLSNSFQISLHKDTLINHFYFVNPIFAAQKPLSI